MKNSICLENEISQHNVTSFSIQGLTDIPELQFPIFIIFLLVFLIILIGNLTIFIVIMCDSNLHTPMYLFLMNLSLIDISSTSNIIPKLLNVMLTQNKAISFAGCIAQVYIFTSLTCTEILLLGAMAYDRYLAICHPLHYFILMSLRQTAALAVTAWTVGFLDTTGHASLISRLSFCASHRVDHIFCDVNSLLKISCSNTFNVEMLSIVEGAILGVPTFLFTLISYIFIISNILKIKTTEGRRKAFSTCASHLTCVTVFYVTVMGLYMRPTSSYQPKQEKYVALLFIVLVPMLNPIIYSLKNQDVKDALMKLKNKMTC
ncbi:olfactory receptor 1019-like [Spea bombifrons]|uniref:olfactory receptor 1019-like n=1 Tax=Spea bombifrons TaxID=233779 RepID=UPI00234A9363|nr:olfactory receptor 1019-like [Spea bombifrons]